jgi:hypothetical protein
MKRQMSWALLAGVIALPAFSMTAACGSSGTTSGSSASSATASHQASSPAQPTKASTTLCRDNAALQTPLTNLADDSGGKGTLTQVTADLKDAQAEFSALAGDAHGAFSIQINALKSALTTLQTAVRGVSSGSNPPAKISTALDGVTTADSDLLRVLAQGGCVAGG